MSASGAQITASHGRNPLHRIVPFGLRVFVRKRLRDWHDFHSQERIAKLHGEPSEYPILVSEKSSPLSREAGSLATNTVEKTRNLELAAARLDRLVILPGEVLSFNRTVGPSTRRLGYLPALEFRDGETVTAIGRGLCQLANLIVLLGIEAGMEILERHRHSLDLFPDTDRTAPFGCGATVFYNYVDLRLRNSLDVPLLLETAVKSPVCWAAIRSASPMPFQCKMIETDHEFVKVDGVVRRRNRLWREYDDGSSQRRELLCHNDCRVDILLLQLPTHGDAVAVMKEIGMTYTASHTTALEAPWRGNIGLMFSTGTMEHYTPEELERWIEMVKLALRPDGILSHVMDHRDHRWHADKSISPHLQYTLSEPEFRQIMGNSLDYHNRWLRSDWMRFFESHGYVVDTRTVIPNTPDLIQTAPHLLAPEYQHATESDLASLVTHFIARRRDLEV